MRTNDEIMDILEQKKEEKGLSISEIARQLGMAKSAVSRYFNRTRQFPLDRIDAISKILGLDAQYVLGFSDLDSLTTIYNQLESSRQKKVHNFAEHQLEEQSSIKETATVYVISKLSAGTGIIDLDPEDIEEREFDGYIPTHDLAFEVSGNSMEPMFEDGEIVFVEKTEDIRSGQVIAVQINEEAYIKKAYKENNQLRLVSLNKEYDDIFADGNDGIRVVGRVIL